MSYIGQASFKHCFEVRLKMIISAPSNRLANFGLTKCAVRLVKELWIAHLGLWILSAEAAGTKMLHSVMCLSDFNVPWMRIL